MPQLLVSLLLLFPAVVLAVWQPDYILRINNASLAADCTVRTSVTINGTSPGPTIRVREGDHVWIRVYNDMTESNTTLHWHGISQFASPFADGTPQTSQWPIAPQNYFDYEFKLDSGSAGSYMYHTHVGFEVVTAYGAFIVEDATPPPYIYASDLVLLFGDFYHASDYDVAAGLLGAPFTWLNDPQALTVNGNAYGECDEASGVSCQSGCHTEIVTVQPSTTYRVRAIGITALSFIYMAIEDHPGFELIEVDSDYITAYTAPTHFELNSGQRFSFLLRTKSAAELETLGKTVFWANLETRWRSTRDQGAWLLSYDYTLKSGGSGEAQTLAYAPIPTNLSETVPLPDEAPFWVVPALEPLFNTEEPPSDEEVSRQIFVDMQQLSTGNDATQKIFWHVNGYMYSEESPSLPYLVQAYENPSGLQPDYSGALANGGYDNSTESFPIHLGETVDIVFLNLASYVGTLEAHPWHIHGQHPWLMAQGLGNFSNEAFAAARENMTGKPIKRDTQVLFAGPSGADYTTSTVPPGQNGGWMVYRIKAEVAGAFLLHCHTQPHMTMGLATVLLIGVEDLPSLPADFTQEYATYNATQSEVPKSFFELQPQRRHIANLMSTDH